MDFQALAGAIATRLRRDGPLALIDLGIVLTMYLVALVVRFDGVIPEEFWSSFLGFAPAVVAFHLASNYLFGLYGRMWRFASIHEAERLILSGITAGVLVVSTSLLGDLMRLLPLSVAVMG